MEIGEQWRMNSRRFLAVGAALLLAAAAGGCSSGGPEREFAVPKALCGVSVPAEALARLLPASGKQLSAERTDGSAQGTGLCEVSVDGDVVLIVSKERITVGRSAQSILNQRLHVLDQKSAEGGSVAYVDHAAVSLVKCRGADVEEEDISTLIQTLKPGRKDEAAMKDLITGYTTSLKKQQPCLKKNG
ncbi:hypothetical protein [Streptomyces griseosporeus]|uniref:hypothetical protein n=1 Tax=Streptomyces griseosporeus TaxID=1910 RepID=UPI0037019055